MYMYNSISYSLDDGQNLSTSILYVYQNHDDYHFSYCIVYSNMVVPDCLVFPKN